MKATKLPLLLGAALFLSMSIAHILAFKVPGLFIYFNIPSYEYQDKIISLLTFGWALIFLHAAYNPSKPLIRIILIMSIVALCVVFYINYSTNFSELSPGINTLWFHSYAILLATYWCWLALTYHHCSKNL